MRTATFISKLKQKTNEFEELMGESKTLYEDIKKMWTELTEEEKKEMDEWELGWEHLDQFFSCKFH